MKDFFDQEFLPFSKPCISQAAIDEVVDSLRSGWLATGPKVQRFTEMMKNYFQAQHVLPLNSGTAGLHLALLALDLQPGDEVITTPFTFAATLNTIVLVGAKPVLVDIEPGTYNIDVSQIPAAITSRTRAIVPVHFAGLPVDLDLLYAIANQHGLRVIEDMAHAIGTEYKGRKIGSFGDTHVLSFHPNKNITTGEGGCVVTRDESLMKKIAFLHMHGIDRDVWNRFSKQGKQHYDVVMAGYKYNMSDLQAALGLHQLPALEDFIGRRTVIARRYLDELRDWPQWTLPQLPTYEHQHAWHLFCPLLNLEAAGMDRNTFVEQMKMHDIGVGYHYRAAHLFSFYQQTYGYQKGDFPVAESVSERTVSLPLFPDLQVQQQERVIAAMTKIFNQ